LAQFLEELQVPAVIAIVLAIAEEMWFSDGNTLVQLKITVMLAQVTAEQSLHAGH
jgi:hypothetical protein